MTSDAVNRHFHEPHNRREMTGAAGTGRAGDTGCGAEITMQIRFQGGAIADAAFQASGSSAIVAAGSVMTKRLEGMDWHDAAAIPASALYMTLSDDGGEELEWQALSALDKTMSDPEPGSLAQACEFCIEALHRAIEDSIRNGTFPAAEGPGEKTVIVAMSGGVDSSTACMLEREAGRDVVGVTMRLWNDDLEGEKTDSTVSCCSPGAIRDARQICHALGLPHLTVDYSEEFTSQVVIDFVSEYLAGRTPNPCTICNGSFRFPALVDLAKLVGATRIATGHYARIVSRESETMLARGLDAGKDQSYMLWGIDHRLLPWIDFPLGELDKARTRDLARRAGIMVHDRVDSQDVCFIPDDDYRRFIIDRAGEAGLSLPGEGEIVTTDGRIVGYHRGYLNFTIGQRRGLGISSEEPLYVVRTEPETNTVVVGTRAELAVSSVTLHMVNRFIPVERLVGRPLLVQIRYNSPAVPCSVALDEEERLQVEIEEPIYGVAPGQSAVIYDDDIVVAGGRIL